MSSYQEDIPNYVNMYIPNLAEDSHLSTTGSVPFLNSSPLLEFDKNAESGRTEPHVIARTAPIIKPFDSV